MGAAKYPREKGYPHGSVRIYKRMNRFIKALYLIGIGVLRILSQAPQISVKKLLELVINWR
jgi:hypothetical protein